VVNGSNSQANTQGADQAGAQGDPSVHQSNNSHQAASQANDAQNRARNLIDQSGGRNPNAGSTQSAP
jgi:hypothetical protein